MTPSQRSRVIVSMDPKNLIKGGGRWPARHLF
jgi:hypothetical protein